MDTTTTKPTMRGLLERWAVVEPDRCHLHEEIEGFTVNFGNGWDLILTSNALVDNSLMRIQWAVQAAIVARGWSFELKYNPDCPDPHNPYDATVDSSTSGGWGHGNDGFAVPLLEAYLHTLENSK